MVDIARSLGNFPTQAKIRHAMRASPAFGVDPDMPDDIARALRELDRVTSSAPRN